MLFDKKRSNMTTDIHQRSQTSYTAGCNGVASYGAQFRGLRVFCWLHMQKHMQSKYVYDLRRSLRGIFFTPRPQYMQVTYAPDEPRLFWLRD